MTRLVIFLSLFSCSFLIAQNNKAPQPDNEQMQDAVTEMQKMMDTMDINSLLQGFDMEGMDSLNLEELMGGDMLKMFGGEDMEKMMEGMDLGKMMEGIDMQEMNKMLEGIDMTEMMKMMEGMDLSKMMEGVDMEELSKMFEGMDFQQMTPPGKLPDNPTEQDGKKNMKKI